MDESPTSRRFDLVYQWSAAYLVNLFVPLPLGIGVTEGGGKYGMFAGVLVLWALGTVVCRWPGRLGSALVSGAWIISFTQFAPVLQVGSGILAAYIWTSVTSERLDGLSEFGGFAVTLMTGQPLAFLAILMGYRDSSFSRPKDPPAAESGEDPS